MGYAGTPTVVIGLLGTTSTFFSASVLNSWTVTEDGTRNLVRRSDGKIIGSYAVSNGIKRTYVYHPTTQAAAESGSFVLPQYDQQITVTGLSDNPTVSSTQRIEDYSVDATTADQGFLTVTVNTIDFGF